MHEIQYFPAADSPIRQFNVKFAKIEGIDPTVTGYNFLIDTLYRNGRVSKARPRTHSLKQTQAVFQMLFDDDNITDYFLNKIS